MQIAVAHFPVNLISSGLSTTSDVKFIIFFNVNNPVVFTYIYIYIYIYIYKLQSINQYQYLFLNLSTFM